MKKLTLLKKSVSHIQRLVRQGEHQRLDFKYEIEDPRKIARSLVAFANTDGGRLLIGVKDNGKVIGINSEEEIHMVEGAAELYCLPPVSYMAKLWSESGKNVLEVYVPKSEQTHFVKSLKDKPMAYFRQADENLLANVVQLRLWELQRGKQNKKFTYGEREEILFQHIRETGSISLSKFSRLSGLAFREAVDTLAHLIKWEVMRMELKENKVLFLMNKDSVSIESLFDS